MSGLDPHEIAGHDPRGHVSMSLSYATSVRGGCHLEGLTYFLDRGITAPDFGYTTPPDPHRSDDKPPIVVTMQNYLSVFNPLGLCKFLLRGQITPDRLARWINLAAGWEITGDEVMRTGESLFNLHRLQNVRLGINRQDDVLPPRLLTQARPTGGAAGVLPNLEQILADYYTLRGWDEHGVPTRA